MAVTLRRITSQIEITADCPVGAVIGDMVFASSDRVGGIYQVDLCEIDSVNKRPIGMVKTKSAPTRCIIQVQGLIEGIYTGLTVGRPLFLGVGVGARLVQISPGHPNSGKRYHQIAGTALASDVISLDLQSPMVLLPT
jgi:hypothetical protein